MRFSNDGINWSAWEPYSSIKSWTLSEGEGLKRVRGQFADTWGNTFTTTDTIILEIPDKTPPVTEILLKGTLGNNDWFVLDVLVTLTATDEEEGSGVDKTEYSLDGTNWLIYTEPFLITTEGETIIYYRSTDKAGNVEMTKEQTIKIDKTPPVITGAPTTEPNENGWYNIDVTVHFKATDTISGIDTVTPDVTISTEGENQSVTGVAIDVAGNDASFTVEGINIDKAAPVTEISLEGTLGNNDWFVSDVKVVLSASDSGGSGLTKTEYGFDGINWNIYTEPFTINTEGITTAYYRSTDKAGNTETTKEQTIKIDKTAPDVQINSPVDGTEYILNQEVVADWVVEDFLSGIDSVFATAPNGEAIDTSMVGEKAFTLTAADFAGNITTKTVTYYVCYSFSGLLPPFSEGREYKLGRVIPLKFQLTDVDGNSITNAVARLYLAKVEDGVVGDEIEAISSGNSNEDNLFRYDEDNNLYIFNLSTDELSVGTWQLRIELDDGTSKYATITFK